MTRKSAQRTAPLPETDLAVDAAVVESTAAGTELAQHAEPVEYAAEARPAMSEAIRHGAEDARAAAARVFDAAGTVVHKGVYSGFYYLTYGVVFGAMAVGRLLPANTAVGQGVHDGFVAARQAFDQEATEAEAVMAEPAAAAG